MGSFVTGFMKAPRPRLPAWQSVTDYVRSSLHPPHTATPPAAAPHASAYPAKRSRLQPPTLRTPLHRSVPLGLHTSAPPRHLQPRCKRAHRQPDRAEQVNPSRCHLRSHASRVVLVVAYASSGHSLRSSVHSLLAAWTPPAGTLDPHSLRWPKACINFVSQNLIRQSDFATRTKPTITGVNPNN